MEKILVSGCLLGNNVKYNGGNNYCSIIEELKKKYEIIPICPEVMGGLSIPRDPSEILEDKVISSKQRDVTKEFTLGANTALAIALKDGITIAVLKDGSPSCGSTYIYDGTFSHTRISAMGLTAKVLSSKGITIYTEKTMHELL